MNSTTPLFEAPVTVAGGAGAGQPEYEPVEIVRATNPDFWVNPKATHNAVVMAFRPSEDERRRLAEGEDIYISLITFGHPQQPILVDVGPQTMAEIHGLQVKR